LNLLLKEENMILTLIGPIEDKFLDRVENKNRLILKGPMTGADLYQELNKFDVTIAPYSSRLINNDNSGAGTGNKIYQYLAMGKPVVISQMAGLQGMNFSEGMIYIAPKEKDFPSLINKAFNENNEEKIRKRIEFAKSNTWEIRIDYLVKYLRQAFPET
jgi:glycosyltransferase involved in cell wall biosynthesis